MSPQGPNNIPTRERSGNFIPSVRLKDDGESCKLRFITDYDDFYWERFHRQMEGKEFRGFKICEASAFNRPCSACVTGNRSVILLMGWVYEITHDYMEPGEYRKAVKEGKRTTYRQEVNRPKLLRLSSAQKNSIQLRVEKFGTLLGREFEWIRTGKPYDTKVSYTLDPLDKLTGAEDEEVATVANKLPSLEDVVLERVTMLDSDEGTTPTKSYRTVSIEEPNDFDKLMGSLDDEEPF